MAFKVNRHFFPGNGTIELKIIDGQLPDLGSKEVGIRRRTRDLLVTQTVTQRPPRTLGLKRFYR